MRRLRAMGATSATLPQALPDQQVSRFTFQEVEPAFTKSVTSARSRCLG